MWEELNFLLLALKRKGPQSKGCGWPLKAGKFKEIDPIQSWQKGMRSYQHLDFRPKRFVRFWPTELYDNEFVTWAAESAVICYSSHRKLTQSLSIQGKQDPKPGWNESTGTLAYRISGVRKEWGQGWPQGFFLGAAFREVRRLWDERVWGRKLESWVLDMSNWQC